MSPTCPKCGTVNCQVKSGIGECLEADCRHIGKPSVFRQGWPVSRPPINTWARRMDHAEKED